MADGLAGGIATHRPVLGNAYLVRVGQDTGAGPQNVLQAFMHVDAYACMPRTNHAIKLVSRTYAKMGVAV